MFESENYRQNNCYNHWEDESANYSGDLFNQNAVGNLQSHRDFIDSNFRCRAGQKVIVMMEHVKKIISDLLESLKYLYETNGVNYSVVEYYKPLIRLLTPHELMSHFHFIDNRQLFNRSEFHESCDCQYKQKCKKLEGKLKDKNAILDSFSIKKNFPGKDRNYSKPQTSQLYSPDYKQEQIVNFVEPNYLNKQSSLAEKLRIIPLRQGQKGKEEEQRKKSQPRKYSNRTILSNEMERDLGLWILEEVKRKNIFKLKDIAAMAKKFAHRVKGFKSSVGWVNRFLDRHVYLKHLLKLSRIEDFDTVDKLYNKIKSQLYASGQEKTKPNEGGPQHNQIIRDADWKLNKSNPPKLRQEVKCSESQEQAQEFESSRGYASAEIFDDEDKKLQEREQPSNQIISDRGKKNQQKYEQ